MSELRILTVRQPYAWAIIHGGKDIENRTRNIAALLAEVERLRRAGHE